LTIRILTIASSCRAKIVLFAKLLAWPWYEWQNLVTSDRIW